MAMLLKMCLLLSAATIGIHASSCTDQESCADQSVMLQAGIKTHKQNRSEGPVHSSADPETCVKSGPAGRGCEDIMDEAECASEDACEFDPDSDGAPGGMCEWSCEALCPDICSVDQTQNECHMAMSDELGIEHCFDRHDVGVHGSSGQ